MRWDAQRAGTDDGSLPGLELGAIPGVLRSVRTPEFAGVTFHEVRCRSALNRVPGTSRMPFRWTVNPMRGCVHACAYCFARPTHEYLEFGAGEDFERQIVVKTNVAEVLRAEVSRPSWEREHVALGTNTDPYQRPEGRYRLMPGVVEALAASGTSVSILTKGTLLRRDLPLLQEAASEVEVGVGVSLALLDDDLQRLLEPGTPSARARLELVRQVREVGLPCAVLVAPVLPWLTDGVHQLDALFGELARAGASAVTVLPLHLRGSVKPLFLGWLGRHRPELVGRYRGLYGDRANVPAAYAARLRERVRPLLRRYRLASSGEHREASASGHRRWDRAVRDGLGVPTLAEPAVVQSVLF